MTSSDPRFLLVAYFKQSPVKEGNKATMGSRRTKSKFAGDINVGIFLGYKLKCGGKWKHEYLVCDLRDLAAQDFGRGARNSTKAMHIQTVRNILINMLRCFPCRPEYDKANQTLEGIKEASPHTRQWMESLWIHHRTHS